MATKSGNQQTRQIGEELIVAKLRLLGLTATPFERNLQVVDGEGHAVRIWFKAINSTSWQFYINKFLDVRIEGDRQVVRGKRRLTDPLRVCIFVHMRPGTVGSAGDFYVFREHDLQNFFCKTYTGRVKPLDVTSFHCAIWPKDLKHHQDRWDVLLDALQLKVSPEIAAVQDFVNEIAGKSSRGQGYQISAAQRRGIEGHAMDCAERYFRGKGWRVENVSAQESYDLCCRRADEELHVEVKGTKSAGDEILLTRNEVEHARAYPQVALFVVSNIVITSDSDGKPRAQGGDATLREPWKIDDSQLVPLAFACKLDSDGTRRVSY